MKENNETVKQKKKRTPEEKKKIQKRIWFSVLALVLAVLCFFAGFFTDRLTLDEGMRTLLAVKNKIQSEYYKEVTDEEFYKVLLEAVNDDLLDSYSEYMTAEEYAATRTAAQGVQSGLGIVFTTLSSDGESQMFVSRVCGNSPAETAGVLEGDYLVGFGMTETEITESAVFDEFAAFLGDVPDGKEIVLRLLRDGEIKTLSVAKAKYTENYVFYRTNTTAYRFTGEDALSLTEGGEPLLSLPDDAAYIRLTHFNGNAAGEFTKALTKFKTDKKKHLVLDLRGNGGGYMDILQEIAQYFCKSSDKNAPVITYADYGEKQENFKANGNVYKQYFAADSRICVLADSLTASASEVLLGCLLDYGATAYADVCLSERNGVAKTYGKGIMQTTFPFGLIYSDAIKLTTATLRWPVTGKCIHDRGVLPEDGVRTVAEDLRRDAEVNAAIAQLFS